MRAKFEHPLLEDRKRLIHPQPDLHLSDPHALEPVEVTVGTSSKTVGKTIKDINIPQDCTLAMISRSDELIPPRGDTVIQARDLVTVVGKPDAVLKVTRFLHGD